jgi:hypothetical protein
VAEGAPDPPRCARCGLAVEGVDRFCPGCSSDLNGAFPRPPAPTRRCPSCAHAVSAYARFCNGCGRNLTRASRTPWLPLGLIGTVVAVILVGVGLTTGKATDDTGDRSIASVVATAPIATPVPGTDDWQAAYPAIDDVREIAIRPWNRLGDRLSFRGTIYSIRVARPGEGFDLGDEDSQEYAAELMIAVTAPDRSFEVVAVGYDGDTIGMFDDTEVQVYGTLTDTESYDDDYGGEYAVPLVAADLVQIDPFDGLPPAQVG